MNISLPATLKTFVVDQVAGRNYGASSEHIRELVRKDQDRQQMKALLLDGAASKPTEPVDAAYFADLRAQVGSRSGQ